MWVEGERDVWEMEGWRKIKGEWENRCPLKMIKGGEGWGEGGNIYLINLNY